MTFPADATLADIGEFRLIRALTDLFGQGEQVLLGPGDDAAVLSCPDGQVVVSTDLHELPGTGEPLAPHTVRLPVGSGSQTAPAFRIRGQVVSACMAGARNHARRDDRPVLLFFSNRRSGPAPRRPGRH